MHDRHSRAHSPSPFALRPRGLNLTFGRTLTLGLNLTLILTLGLNLNLNLTLGRTLTVAQRHVRRHPHLPAGRLQVLRLRLHLREGCLSPYPNPSQLSVLSPSSATPARRRLTSSRPNPHSPSPSPSP